MFVRRLKNRSGSTSIQVIQKINGRYKVYKTIGCATIQQNIEKLELLANQEIEKISAQPRLFKSETDCVFLRFRTLSPDLNGHLVLIKPDALSCAKRTVLSSLFFA